MSRQRWFALWLVAMTVLAAVWSAAGVAQAAPARADEPPESGAYRLYLPLISRPPGRIFGRVTQSGVSAANVPVSLRFYNGSAWFTLSTSSTDVNGYYTFYNAPALGANQKYQVVFENTAQDDGRLARWNTRELAGYAVGGQVEIGNFDVAALALAVPDHEQTVGLPFTFRWIVRAGVPTDSYALRLYDPVDLNPLYVAPYVGYSDNTSLASLPAGFSANTPYTWDVVLRGPDGGTGVSRQARAVRLGAGLYGRVTLNGAAVDGVALQLRFYNGSAWSTIATTTTAADGGYLFASVPTLGAGQKCYVRYENAAQTDARLFLWSTRTLAAYAAGSAVEMGNFDIADVALSGPAGGATVSLPTTFQWVRRPSTPGDSYAIEIYDPNDYDPRWLSPLVGYNSGYTLTGLAPALAANTQYAWDVIISAADGGSGVSRAARLVRFSNRGTALRGEAEASAEWPFEEALPARPLGSYQGSK